jgi:hypothetical protein
MRERLKTKCMLEEIQQYQRKWLERVEGIKPEHRN